MKPRRSFIPLIFLICLTLAACSPAPEIVVQADRAPLQFDGDRTYALEEEFVTGFPNRDSGTESNTQAAAWVRARFEEFGWICQEDSWEIVSYSRTIPLKNVICELEGESPRQILVAAHHDQAPMTVQGADNDGAGIAIMLHLAEIFAAEDKPAFTLTFISTDGEEYGIAGSQRYIQTHEDVGNVIAGISLDNVGKVWYTGLKLESQGLFSRYGDLWLRLAILEIASERGGLTDLYMDDVVLQILNQAVPIGAMDQAPMISAGIPAVGFAGYCPPENSAECSATYHSPGDTIDNQDPFVLEAVGRVAEATIRQLLAMDSFPRESGPYLYFENSQSVFRGPLLWITFSVFVALFYAGSIVSAKSSRLKGWKTALPHFLGYWIPMAVAFLMLHLYVAVGLMDRFATMPGMAKDPVWYSPRWPAIGLFIISLTVFLYLGRRLVARYPRPEKAQIKSLALLVVGLACTYILIRNPFSLILTLPLLFWFLIRGRRGAGRALDIVLLLLGGLVIFAAIYFLGFAIWPLKWYVLWYLLMMFSVPQMIGIPTMLLVTGILSAGLAMVTEVPGGVKRVEM
jgi:hypothetical protein